MKEFIYTILIFIYLVILFIFSNLLKPFFMLVTRLRKTKQERSGPAGLHI